MKTCVFVALTPALRGATLEAKTVASTGTFGPKKKYKYLREGTWRSPVILALR